MEEQKETKQNEEITNNPPDLGISVNEEIGTTEHLS